MVGVGVAADQPQTHVVDRSACLPIEWVSSDFLLCLVWVEEKIGGFFFFFLAGCGLLVGVVVVVVVVVGVVVTMTDGRGDCGRYCVCFLDSEIYYFIVVVILFFCNIYIILLC